MATTGRSMLYSLLSFAIILSLLEMYREKLASSELLTILGGFVSSLLFLLMLTFIGNYQESSGTRTGCGAVALAEIVALVAAATVHRVCITTCFLFSAGLLYEVHQISGMVPTQTKPKGKRY
ncbi:protein KRTCAP2 homolog [Zingiber officinale]|uniref:protein KRTCAP2 homolog n=1 Tax=Zingiber officinale TaxID=94328 RepID=UPI001C4C60BD|nr:protein KRTCAP2 homolog [Zingiber officinale]